MKNKKLTTLELYWYIIGAAIGSGLFVLLPIIIGDTGKSAVFAVLAGTFIVLCAQLYNLIIASFFPLRGGDYSQVAFMCPPVMAGVYGLIWLMSCLTMASFATSALSYAADVIPGIPGDSKVIVVIVVTAFFAVSYFGAKFGAKVEGAMVILLLVALGAFVAFGLPKVDFATLIGGENFFLNGFKGFSSALGLCVFLCLGPTMTPVSFTSELENPTKTAPKAMLGGVALLSAIYVLITVVACGVLPAEEIGGQDLAITAAVIFPKSLYVVFVICGAVFALLTSLLGSVNTSKYPFLQMADEGWVPAAFKKTTKNGWPYVVYIVMYILVLIPVVFNISLDTIVAWTNIPAYVIVFYVNLRCLGLPKRYPEQWKRSMLHMPTVLYNILCVFAMICSVYLIYCLAVGLSVLDFIMSVVITLCFFGYSWFCLKTKRVDPAYLEDQKKAIAQEILDYEKTQKA